MHTYSINLSEAIVALCPPIDYTLRITSINYTFIYYEVIAHSTFEGGCVRCNFIVCSVIM